MRACGFEVNSYLLTVHFWSKPFKTFVYVLTDLRQCHISALEEYLKFPRKSKGSIVRYLCYYSYNIILTINEAAFRMHSAHYCDLLDAEATQ